VRGATSSGTGLICGPDLVWLSEPTTGVHQFGGGSPTTPSIGATIEVYSRLSSVWLCSACARQRRIGLNDLGLEQ